MAYNDNDVFTPNQYEDVYYEAPIVAKRAPTTRDKYEIGKVWIDTTNDDAYFITSVTVGAAVWINAGGGSGSFASITATTGDIIADAGNIVATLGDLSITAGTVTIGAFGLGVLQSSAAGLISSSNGTDGQVLIASTVGAATWNTLTAGGGITITEGAGTITITNPGATGTTFTASDANVVAPDGVGNTDVIGYDANITTDGAVANTLKVRLADDITTVGALVAGANLGMTTGTCTIISDDDSPQAIYLHANAGTAETIVLYADQGTSISSIELLSDVGGLTFSSGLAGDDAININATSGGVDIDGATQVNIASSQNAASAVVINASAGGIDISSSGGAGEDIDITTTSSINLSSTENAAEAIYLHANSGTAETIHIHADQGTNAASVNIASDDGGVTVTAGLAGNDAININATAGGVDIDGVLQVNIASAQAAADAIVIDASNAAGGIDVDFGTGGLSVVGGNGAINLESGAGAINVGVDAVAHTVTIGNVTGATGVAINSGTDGIGLASTGAGDITVNSSDTVLIDSAGVLELNSSAGVIGIGTDDIDQNINIGAVGERVVTIGNIVGVTGIALNSGTAGIAMASTGAGDITLDSSDTVLIDSAGVLELNSSAGVIGIGNDAVTQNINIGTGAAARVITVGNVTDATQVVLNSGTAGIAMASTGAGDITIDSSDTVLIDGAGVVEINSSAGVIGIGNDAVAQDINIGTGAAARTITTGNSTSGTNLILTGGNTGAVSVTPVTSSVGGVALTCSGNVGVTTFTGQTTAAAATLSLTITNTTCTVGSAILLSASNLGANNALMTVSRITPAAGSFVVDLINRGDAALNGDVIITFWIVAA